MNKINIIFYIPTKERKNTPYSSKKSATRHDKFISYFPDNTQFFLATYEYEIPGRDIHEKM
jgi:hypothetical protein